MSDTIDATINDTDATQRDNDATECIEWVSVADAAERLGLSVRTVQRHAKEGKLQAREEDRRLLICVPIAEYVTRHDAPNTDNVATEESFDATTAQTDATGNESESALIAQLQSENARLWAELEKRNIAESELRRLMLSDKNELLQLRQKVALLLPSGDTPQPVQNGTQEARSEAETAETGKDSPSGFWARLFGRK